MNKSDKETKKPQKGWKGHGEWKCERVLGI